ncbi:MAG TPA: UDP-N-acetylglucosamine--N-acetylmuramyl-(pentapeptide) pyrophosphoryl-undecaprenol N-acetylglucosamine transferase [Dictyoglomaceae bacterium]|nr:UDP-N-acetylglucosamine--N-acetylmuramyl-(pentapeptide) pyrophosphoryl-undecaprenol N-acetylglucosamine transferase [Dictyoglomaceae bacterium]HOL38861.1 UDP-N-acetylglucosamine--N-acetylmuramyl-(pentapeptide) pyrophosphoryl-undecaprenol N-acetylglucosamine transferase [Dictyoglomaceae bacterium]HOP95388.1 UDP-N-acetylglucosamine--N-acetylmuramyl-(pentapeptide) pyrophosphoryl-undecaprenol N-acetylglucosamine transferase [Dictyoglomaceae bacterium]HPP15722.1 UDP-N-acetylglucosamine--N-acetylmu
MINLVFATGGTGGHVFPGLNMAEFIKDRAPHWEISFIGRKNSFEEKIISEKFSFYGISISKSSDLKSTKLFKSVKEVNDIFKKLKPDLLIIFGSYNTVPIAISAVLKNYPFWLHEQNVFPGRVTKMFAKFATGVAISFPQTKVFLNNTKKVYLTGNFVKTELLTRDKEECKRKLEFKLDRKLLLITGGSQGAMRINEIAKLIVPSLLKEGWQILHQIGEKHYEEFSKSIPSDWIEAGYKPVSFIKNMEVAIRAADLAISRAGATTISQFLIAGLPAVYIPYPYAKDDHQRYNAEVVVEAGGGDLIFEKDLTPEVLLKTITSWDDKRLEKASDICISLSNPNGREFFWNLILKTLERRN